MKVCEDGTRAIREKTVQAEAHAAQELAVEEELDAAFEEMVVVSFRHLKSWKYRGTMLRAFSNVFDAVVTEKGAQQSMPPPGRTIPRVLEKIIATCKSWVEEVNKVEEWSVGRVCKVLETAYNKQIGLEASLAASQRTFILKPPVPQSTTIYAPKKASRNEPREKERAGIISLADKIYELEMNGDCDDYLGYIQALIITCEIGAKLCTPVGLMETRELTDHALPWLLAHTSDLLARASAEPKQHLVSYLDTVIEVTKPHGIGMSALLLLVGNLSLRSEAIKKTLWGKLQQVVENSGYGQLYEHILLWTVSAGRKLLGVCR